MKGTVPPDNERLLPPLTQIVNPANPKERNAKLLELLRKAALAATMLEPKPFYSVRAVAKQFSVSPTTVSRIYDRLKEEGVLSSAWGSRTNAQPSHLDRQLRLRGRIALLVPFAVFFVTPQYRGIIIGLVQDLWKLGFASELSFCETEDSRKAAFFEGIVNQRPDAVVWFLQSLGCSICARCFIDRGIRVIGYGQHQAEVVRRTLAFARQPPPANGQRS